MALEHELEGICIERAGQAVLVIGQGASGMALPGVLADGCVRVRYTFTRQLDGVQLVPQSVRTERGLDIAGPEALDWLVSDDAYQQPRADVFCLTLDGQEEAVWARDLDLCRPVEPYIYVDRPDSVPLLLADVVIVSNEQVGPVRLIADEAEAISLIKESQVQQSPVLTGWLARTARCNVVGGGDEQALANILSKWLQARA